MKNDESTKTNFASVDWQIYEVQGVARQAGLELSEDQARRFLEHYEVRLKGVMTKAAFDYMCHFFKQWGAVEKKIFESRPENEESAPSDYT